MTKCFFIKINKKKQQSHPMHSQNKKKIRFCSKKCGQNYIPYNIRLQFALKPTHQKKSPKKVCTSPTI